jgi:hypothetical protein
MPLCKKSFLLLSGAILYVIIVLPVIYLAALLLMHGITFGGRFFAVGTLGILITPILLAVRILCPGILVYP